MSLKGFHIIFIVVSILLMFGFAFWNVVQFQQTQTSTYGLTAVVSLVSAFALIIYEVLFVKKTI